MDNSNQNISDKEIRELLKKRLIEQLNDDNLVDLEAKLVFGIEATIVPSAKKEKELLNKLKRSKTKGSFLKWFLPSAAVITVLSFFIFHNSNKTSSPNVAEKKLVQPTNQINSLNEVSKNTNTNEKNNREYLEIIYNPIPSGPGVQRVEKILKENADRIKPILVSDTIVFSPHSPIGYGNQLEFFGNDPNDQLYFEKEHNTVWYKFIARESGQLTFDIIPVNLNDDYDFMLFKFSGSDFYKKVISKEIKPIRTCISRNDKNLKSMTGLSLDESSESYIHSGVGSSYVKYIRVEKGEMYCLLIDNVYDNGDGHSIRFHYKPTKPGELFVGKLISFDQITFEDSDTEFRKSSRKALDSLYNFLIANPGIKIEIQGHVNSSDGDNPIHLPGKPAYTNLELSQQRAIAIKAFLVNRGVDSNRLSTVGYGSTRLKIPHPKSKKERFMNIRAEILILSLDYKKDLKKNKN